MNKNDKLDKIDEFANTNEGNNTDIQEDGEYLDALLKESENLFPDSDFDDYTEETDVDVKSASDNQNNVGTMRNVKKFRLNMPLLVIGAMMILVAIIVPRYYGNTQSDNSTSENIEKLVEETTTGELNSNAGTNNVRDDESIKTIGVDVDAYYEEEIEETVNGVHLTDIPVTVTEEVDEYFKNSVKELKVALQLDTFVAENQIYGDENMVTTYNRLFENYQNSLEKWEAHSVPQGCEDYEELINISFDAYSYYFSEVQKACSSSSQEEFNSIIKASTSYVNTMCKTIDEKVFESWSPVFYFYGLYE